MAKFAGKIGFGMSSQGAPGVFTEIMTEKDYKGDILRSNKNFDASDNGVNDNLKLSNRVSIVADDFAHQNASVMRYVILGGVRWKITNIEVAAPRLILTLGEVYNGPTP
jgi:hypothetical protein